MHKTPDETKKGLECASNCSENLNGCKNCPYNGFDCCDLHPDALALIQQLQAENAKKDETIMWMQAERDDLKRNIRQFEAERDELIETIKEWSPFGVFPLPCKFCKNVKDAFCGEKCKWCREYNNFEWRGVPKESEA